MSYTVHAVVSRSFDRINGFKPWRKHEVVKGPYKRLKFAKKVRAQLNKDRAIFDCGDGFKDYGPTFSKTWISASPTKEVE